jgi:hypothetical protein
MNGALQLPVHGMNSVLRAGDPSFYFYFCHTLSGGLYLLFSFHTENKTTGAAAF